ncbi:hypothetical protein [Lysobacter gummosus]|uniref:hypothetical protein n=1 Tax=Lysobacter gummosus TaxID=262324 RepID=UPI003627052B
MLAIYFHDSPRWAGPRATTTSLAVALRHGRSVAGLKNRLGTRCRTSRQPDRFCFPSGALHASDIGLSRAITARPSRR